MARGKLSVTEKYAIQGMLHQKLSVEEIAESLERTPAVIQTYVDTELSALQETIARAQLTEVEPEAEEEDNKGIADQITEDMRASVLVKLRQNTGKHSKDCEEILARTIRKLTFVPENDQKLYVLCIRQLNAKDVMQTRSSDGRTGIAIMNGAASQRGDESRKKYKNDSRSARGNVFMPKDNKMK